MTEHFFTCPYCWTTISILIDPSVEQQSFIEDCENCCNPIEFELEIQAEELVSFSANKME